MDAARPYIGKPYSYSSLLDVIRYADDLNGSYINFYGVVTEWDAPRQTTNDLLMTLKLIDPTIVGDDQEQFANAIGLLVFARQRHQLPQVLKPGDIIRLHRVKVQVYNDRPQLVASLGVGRGSFCLFHADPPTDTDPHMPYKTPSQTFHWDEKETIILAAIRQFAITDIVEKSAASTSNRYLKRLKEVFLDNQGNVQLTKVTYADVVGFVIATVPACEAKGTKHSVVWIWDATDAPPYPVRPVLQDQEVSPPPPPQKHQQHQELMEESRCCFPFPEMPIETLQALPCVGTAVPVLFLGNVVDLPAPGEWKKFRNCGFRVVQGQLQGVVTVQSRMLPWRQDDWVVKEWDRRANQSTISFWAPPSADDWASVVITPHHRDYRFTSLRQIAVEAAVPNALPAAYRCLVRVLGHYPAQEALQEACLPASAVWEAAEGDGYEDREQWLFAMQLTVEDGTGVDLNVDVFGREGETFFRDAGIVPQDLSEGGGEAAEGVKQRFSETLAVLTEQQPPKWLEICLKSYYPEVEEGEEEGGRRGVRYRLFDTRLKEQMPLPPPMQQREV